MVVEKPLTLFSSSFDRIQTTVTVPAEIAENITFLSKKPMNVILTKLFPGGTFKRKACGKETFKVFQLN